MLTTVVLAVLAVLLGLGMIAALADRTARATAWRYIALERRWNHENMTTNLSSPPDH